MARSKLCSVDGRCGVSVGRDIIAVRGDLGDFVGLRERAIGAAGGLVAAGQRRDERAENCESRDEWLTPLRLTGVRRMTVSRHDAMRTPNSEGRVTR